MRNDHLERSAKTIRAKKRTHKRWMRVVSTLAAITVFCTTYALILPAITMSTTAYCGLEEHEHSEACYERQLVCGFDENGNTVTPQEGEAAEAAPATEIVTESVLVDAGHIHDESCYNVETTLICENTEEDHEHTEACYEEVKTLVCGEEEREAVYEEREVEVPVEAPDAQLVEAPVSEGTHEHTDACYEEVLICEKEEHKHTDECFANSEADLETAEIWERTLPEKSAMKDEWKEDTLLVAQSQIGYKESEANYVVVNEEHKGYTRYGEMFGVPYGDWCAMFLQFSLHYAGVDTRAMVGSPSVPLWVEAEIENENFYKVGDKIKDEETGEEKEYMPKATDIIFFDWENDGSPDHVGIIEEIKMDEKDDTKIDSIITIEGNSQNEVRRNTYKSNYEHIYGYSEIPDKMTEEELQALAEGRKPEEEKKEEAPKKEYVGVDGTLIVDEDDYTVTVSYTAEAGIPENASLKVVEIMQDADEYNIYNDKAAEEVYGHAEALPYARFFDITILDEEGLEVEPKSTVSVVIDTKDDVLNTEDVEFAAVHFVDESKKVQEEAAPAPVPEATESMAQAGTMEEVTAAIQDAEYIAATTTVVNPEAITTTTMDITTDQVVAFDTDGFSVYGVVMYYTVDFYYVKRTETTPAGSYFDIIGQTVKEAIGANAGGEGEEAEAAAEAEGAAEEEAVEETVADEAVASEETAIAEEATTEAEDTTGEENTIVEETSTPIEYTEYHMPGGTEMLMSDLFEKLEIERNAADIDNVEFTNTELVDFEAIEGDYNIKSLKPFQTYEKLTITFNNGDVVVIDVTDAQYSGNQINSWTDLKNAIEGASNNSEIIINTPACKWFGANETITIKGNKTVKITFTDDTHIARALPVTYLNIPDGMGPLFSVEDGSTLEITGGEFSGLSIVTKSATDTAPYTYSNGEIMGFVPLANGGKFGRTNATVGASVANKGYFIDSNGTVKLTNTRFVNLNADVSDPNKIVPRDSSVGGTDDLLYASNYTNTAPIYSHKGSLTLDTVTIKNNYMYNRDLTQNSTAGAIIANGNLTINDSTIEDNGGNGGIIIHNSGTATITRTSINKNQVNGANSAPVVSLAGSTMTLTDTHIDENVALYPNYDFGDNKYISVKSFETFWNNFLTKPYADYSVPISDSADYKYSTKYFHGFHGLDTSIPGDVADSSSGSAEGYLTKDNGDKIRTAGALLVNGGNVTMDVTGGDKSKSTMNSNLADHGAVLIMNGGTFTMYNGKINKNKGYNAGAVGIGDGEFVMNRGEIWNNQGIWFGTVNVSSKSSSFKMGVGLGLDDENPPKIDNNITMHKGGGVYINSNSAQIERGEITNNQALIFGGGIYLERYCTTQMESVEVTNNEAKKMNVNGQTIENNKTLGIGYGGGMWSCPTGRTYLDTDAIYLHHNRNNQRANGGIDFAIQDYANELQLINAANDDWRVQNSDATPNPTKDPVQSKYINNYTGQKRDDEAKTPYESLTLQNTTNNNNQGKRKVIISGNSASTGGGIASNGNFLFTVEVNKHDAQLQFTKEYNSDIVNDWHDVRVYVSLEKDSVEKWNNGADGQTITKDNKTVEVNLPTVRYRIKPSSQATTEQLSQAAAYDALNSLSSPLAVGNNDLGNGWVLRVAEKVKIGNDWVQVAESPYDPIFTGTSTTPVQVFDTSSDQTQTVNEIIHQSGYKVVSTLKNNQRVGKNLTVQKSVDSLYNNNSYAYDANKLYWFEVSIKKPGSNEGYSTGTDGLYYTIYKAGSNQPFEGDYTYTYKDANDVERTIILSKSDETVGGTKLTNGARRLHWANNGENDSRAMLIPLRAGDKVVFRGIADGAVWTVKEKAIKNYTFEEDTSANKKPWLLADDTPNNDADNAHYKLVEAGAEDDARYELVDYTKQIGDNDPTTEPKTGTVGGTITEQTPNAAVTANNREVPGSISLTKKLNGGDTDTANRQFWFTGSITYENSGLNNSGLNTATNGVTFTILDKNGNPVPGRIDMNGKTSEVITGTNGERATLPICNTSSGVTNSIRFPLKAGETIVFNNVPIGSKWSFTEENASAYSLTYSGDGMVSGYTVSGTVGEATATTSDTGSTTGGNASGSDGSYDLYINSEKAGTLYCLNAYRVEPNNTPVSKEAFNATRMEEISRWSVTNDDSVGATRLPNRYYNSNGQVNTSELALLENRIKNILYYGYHGQPYSEWPAEIKRIISESEDEELNQYQATELYRRLTQEAIYCVVTSEGPSRQGPFTDYIVHNYASEERPDVPLIENGDYVIAEPGEYRVDTLILDYLYKHKDDTNTPSAQLYIYPPTSASSDKQAMIGMEMSSSSTPTVEPGDKDVKVIANNKTSTSRSITVTKEVVGGGNANDEFTFTIKIGNDTYTETLKAGETWTSPQYSGISKRWSVVETNMPANYELKGYKIDSGTLQSNASGWISSSSNINIVATNEYKTGEIELQKVVEDATDADNNVEFTLNVAVNDGTTTTTHSVTVKNGEAAKKIPGLPIGATWTVTETGIPAGYELVGYKKDDDTEFSKNEDNAITGTVGSDSILIIAKNRKSVGTLSLTKELTGSSASDNTKFIFTGHLKKDNVGFNLTDNDVYYKIFEKDEDGNYTTEVTASADTLNSNGGIGHQDRSTVAKYDGGRGPGQMGHAGGANGKTTSIRFSIEAGQKIVFYNLPMGTDWSFTEEAKDGYEFKNFTSNNTGTISADGKTISGTINAGTSNDVSVVATNEKKLPKLRILKVDGSNNTTPLKGAEFQIYADLDSLKNRINWLENGESGNNIGTWYYVNVFAERKPAGYTGDYDGWWNHTVSTYQHKLNNNLFDAYGFQLGSSGRMIDDKGQLIRYMPCYKDYESTKNSNMAFTSGADGYVDFGELPDGTYKIVEKKAPAGYNTMSGAITVTITNGNITATPDPNSNVTNIPYSTATESGYYVTTITVPNTSGASLPNTGGIGTVIFTVLGAVLVIGAGIALLATRKRRD